MMHTNMTIDQRILDRRSTIPFLCPYQLGLKQGKRVLKRRSGSGAAYVDTYSTYIVLCTILTIILSALDALLTLNILARGGVELNNFMAVLIDDSTEKFVSIKLALTSLAMIFLLIHHHVELTQSLKVKHLLILILVGYSTLICYEAGILFFASKY
ncbi:MAG TPA: DUF5658 family protein [Nitrosomonas sp.]|nr:DUF5658 family protein [Nitrosomonas sp.]HMW20336.1 DUF5658 family protein [Nitrosomonas sp.]HMW69502.1 DUF5658 family protein [Nitrosomonas sp.]HMY61667.1 DUF5658 family protein [Nitrosomonas sp.]HMY89056.1 DUF5658 family protein [Nitrosomonas sp.]